MSVVRPRAANLEGRELPTASAFLSDVTEQTHWFKQEDLVIRLCLAEGCDGKLEVGEIQMHMHEHTAIWNADL